MTRQPSPKKGPSAIRLKLTQRLRISWTSYRLKKMATRRVKEANRLALMQVEMDSQLLLMAELEQVEQQLLFRNKELLESRGYRLEGKLPELEPPEKTELDILLGL